MAQRHIEDAKIKKQAKKLLDDNDPGTSDTTSTNKSRSRRSVDTTPRKSNLSHTDEKNASQNRRTRQERQSIVDEKQYLEAAAAFTEALECIESHAATSNPSLIKQIFTFINNRSAMYENGNLPELAIEDCNTIFEVDDISHINSRFRKLRIF
jgi:hypothetical protein